MAEQDRLHEVLGNRPAVHRHEGARGAPAAALDGARDQLLADAALAQDQDRDRGLRRPLAEARDVAHGGGAGDHVGERDGAGGGRARLLRLDLALARLHHGTDGRDDPLGADGLDEEVARAGPHGLHDRLDAALGGQHDHGHPARDLAELVERVLAVGTARRHEVEQAHVGLMDALERRLAGLRHDGVEALALDDGPEQPALCGILVDDQNRLRHGLYIRSSSGSGAPPRSAAPF